MKRTEIVEAVIEISGKSTEMLALFLNSDCSVKIKVNKSSEQLPQIWISYNNKETEKFSGNSVSKNLLASLLSLLSEEDVKKISNELERRAGK